jgi:two-component system sensor histidine kinase RegB
MSVVSRLSGRLDGDPGEAEALRMAVIRPAQIDEPPPGTGVAESIQDITKRKNLLLLVALRWIAVAGQIAAIFVAQTWLSIPLPLVEMGYVLLFLVALNLVSFALLRSHWVIDEKLLFTALLLDVGALTAQLYLSGGAVNPFVSLFLLQVIIGAVLLPTSYVWALAGLAGLCFLWLIRYHQPMDLSAFGLGVHGQSSYLSLHLYGMFLCFLLAAGLTVLFVTRITANLRDRDRLLSELQQRSVEEGHIVRMGLLASGAAHELGTPLATVSVILNDWEHMKAIAKDPSLSADLKEVRSALARCKDIVSGILLAAGEARGEDAERTTLSVFLTDVVEQWRKTRAPVGFDTAIQISRDVPIVAETVVRQTLLNMLDNALEASPSWVGVMALLSGADLVVSVRDKGPGFAPEILANLGKPYHSTKGRPGSGLGLFLVVNVLRKLGGQLTVRNLAEGGALVEMTLPVAALEIPDEQ